MACRDCEEKSAAADVEERLRLLEQNGITSAVLFSVLGAAVYMLWVKVFKEA